MKLFLPVLALLLSAASRQDAPEPVKACEALFGRMTGLDPDDRAAAQAAFRKAARKESLLHPSPAAQVALAFLGEAGVAKDVVKLLDGEPGPLTRAAAAAVGYLPGDPAAEKLLKLLEHDDLPLAMAAARSLARSKAPLVTKTLNAFADKPENPRRKALAHYALELTGPGHLPPILSQAENTAAAPREAAWAALGNLPSAVDDLRSRLREKDADAEYRRLFEGRTAAPDVRAVFGRLLIRVGLYKGLDLVDLACHKTPEVAEWARAAVFDPSLLKPSVVVPALIRKLAGFENEADETKEPIPTLETLLQAAGVRGEGEKLKDRVASARAAWERTRVSSIDKDVNRAIDEGAACLRGRQQADGSWKFCACGAHPNDAHANGTTALAVYTLLKCDLPVRDKAAAQAFEWLLARDLPNHTYTVSLQAMAFGEAIELLLPPPKSKVKPTPEDLVALTKYSKRLRECAEWLVEAQTRSSRGGFECGDWDYGKPANTGMDNSNSQFAVLGLRAAQNAGVPVPERAWAKSLNHWSLDQNKDGSWPYRKDRANPNQGGTRSMSAAGFYCWLVSKASLRRKDPVTLLGEDPIRKGLEHFKKHYPVYELARDRSAGHVHSPYYDLYSLERAMMVAKIDKIDGRDWYHDGALFILANQGGEGEWIDTTDTCFALLFLKKAYIAVATGK